MRGSRCAGLCRSWLFEDNEKPSAAVEAEEVAQSKADAEVSCSYDSYEISIVLLHFECCPH